MIYHVVPLDEWLAIPDRPYSPGSLAGEGFTHCSPDEATTLAVASAYYRKTPGPLMALLINPEKLDVPVRWEAAGSTPWPGMEPDTLFPHVFGPIRREAVEGMMEIVRDESGRATGFAVWS
ncbi:MAG: DUF952 domain-containing protein [Streptomyces sp.]|jgi:uncharacterized protein (DUF952 family)|nr:DUF952 domain-containing protein [Streptomyces sp.]